MDFFTADHHLGHAKILEYTKRPFLSVEEMDDELIARWNEVVREKDTVYHLGDFTFGSYNTFKAYRDRMNGTLKVVPGNHDRGWLRRGAVSNIVEVLPPIYELTYPRVATHPLTLVLCHYPLREWNKKHYGSIHLHGHSHGKLESLYRAIDVGVDKQNMYPVSLDEIKEFLDET